MAAAAVEGALHAHLLLDLVDAAAGAGAVDVAAAALKRVAAGAGDDAATRLWVSLLDTTVLWARDAGDAALRRAKRVVAATVAAGGRDGRGVRDGRDGRDGRVRGVRFGRARLRGRVGGGDARRAIDDDL